MSSKQQRALISFAVTMVTVLLVVGALAIKPERQSSDSTQPAATSETITGPLGSGRVNTSSYRDGTYEATGSYDTPEGTESIDVSVTLENGVVSASSATNQARGVESKFYTENFIGSYRSFVVGKQLDEVRLGIVAGSSLTPNGFNKAIESIKQQARP